MSHEHWDKEWSDFTPWSLTDKIFASPDPCDKDFLEIIGDVSNKKVLDLGCGNGELSAYLASRGAIVTAVDGSISAIKNTLALTRHNHVEVRALQLDIAKLSELDQDYEVVVGRFILHHVGDFPRFTQQLFTVLRPGGRAVFLENSSRNKLLMWFRRHLVGRFGLPKHSDDRESPLSLKEISLLERRFAIVSVLYPELMLIDLIGVYLFSKNMKVRSLLAQLDRAAGKLLPFLKKYSYRQIVEVRK